MTSGYLLDTNIISETRKKQPELTVIDFLSAQPASALYLSSLTIGQLRKGIEKKSATDAAAAASLGNWVDQLEPLYGHRLLSVDAEIATLWGKWSAHRSRPVIDTLLAATAAVHHLVLVTRNSVDVQDLPIKLLNPWAKETEAGNVGQYTE